MMIHDVRSCFHLNRKTTSYFSRVIVQPGDIATVHYSQLRGNDQVPLQHLFSTVGKLHPQEEGCGLNAVY